jgi:transcriptional regulator with XRE-family HTH domain
MDLGGYPERVKTIETIRLANFRRLVDELKEGGLSRDNAVATAMGISAPYLSQLGKGVRGSIESDAARKIERKAGKPEGWLDTDFDLWPFPDGELLARVERLRPEQRIEVQGAMRTAIMALEPNQPPPEAALTRKVVPFRPLGKSKRNKSQKK